MCFRILVYDCEDFLLANLTISELSASTGNDSVSFRGSCNTEDSLSTAVKKSPDLDNLPSAPYIIFSQGTSN